MFRGIIVSSPWYYFVFSLGLGLLFALWLYFRNKKNLDVPRRITRLLFLLRFLVTSLVALLLLNIFLRQVKNETENPVILIALDNSSSVIAGSDSSRLRNEFLPALQKLKEEISGKYSVRTLLFGAHAATSDNQPDFSEKETDLDELLRTIENNYANQNIGALVIASDGIYNKGRNPAAATEKLPFPVFTIALGDTSEIKDVVLKKVDHNQVAYLGNNFPVEVQINARQLKGKEVTVELLDKNTSRGRQKVKFSSDNHSATVNFTLNAEKTGVVTYIARVSFAEGEKNRSNNAQSFAVEVIDNKEKLLLLAASPHPDISAIRESVSGGTTYEISTVILPGSHPPLKAFSLVILHGLSAELPALMNECLAGGVPFWIVNPTTPDNLPGLRITGNLNRFNDSECSVEKSFGLFNTSEELKRFISSAPALKTFFGNYAVSNGSSILISQRIGAVQTEHPVLMFSDNNGIKTGVFAGEGLWKWKLRDYAEHQSHHLFNELISKTVQYLSVKSDKSFFRLSAPRIIAENESFELEAEVYNKSYELITEPEVMLTLLNADNKKFNYTFGKNSKGYRLNAGLLAPGDYRYEASVKVDNDIFKKNGTMSVKEIVTEKLNTVADHQLLFQMSERSGGKLFYPASIGQLRNAILNNENIRPITYSQTSTQPVIELRWIFWLLLALLVIEWWVRKRYLSI